MARVRTQEKVAEAVFALTRLEPQAALTMEGIAARAGVSKQTLYRSWPSTGAIVFDVLLRRSHDASGALVVPDSGDLVRDLSLLASATVDELTDPAVEPLLRALTAQIQTDADLAALYRERLLGPQLRAIEKRLRSSRIEFADDVAELFLGAILHRWLLRSRPFEAGWADAHVARTLRAAGAAAPW